MLDWDDSALLREYVERGSEEAFATLVARHVNKVFSVAWRHTGNTHQAEEITQAVFVILARKGRGLGKGVILSGWLYQTARLTAVTLVRSEIRRARREMEVHMQAGLNEGESEAWRQIAPLLDAGMADLSAREREAVVLRFFDGKSMRELGTALGAGEEAAKKRVGRAVEKLRRFFVKRGVVLSAAGLSAAMAANAVQAAPGSLAGKVTGVALAKGGAAVGGSTLTLVKGALNIMAWSYVKSVAVGVVVVGLAGFSVVQYRAEARLRAQNEELRGRVAELSQVAGENQELSNRLAAANESGARTRSELAALMKSRGKVAAGKASAESGAGAEKVLAAAKAGAGELPKNSWMNAGFGSPEDALKSRGWAVLNGDRELFRQSVYITDGARKLVEDALVQMAKASTAPDKDRYIQDALNNKYGVEEALLMPMAAENRDKTYTSYKILSEVAASEDEKVLEVETDMASAAAKTETLKFQRLGGDWKVVVDEDFVRRGMGE